MKYCGTVDVVMTFNLSDSFDEDKYRFIIYKTGYLKLDVKYDFPYILGTKPSCGTAEHPLCHPCFSRNRASERILHVWN